MGKNKRSFKSLEDLRKLKVDEEGFKEKSTEEIARLEIDKKTEMNSPQDYLTRKTPKGKYSPNHISSVKPGRKASAPYNFVPLNEKNVKSEFDLDNNPRMDLYSGGKNTGYIDISIETKTPLYIRDLLTKAEMAEKEKNDRFINPDFFTPGGVTKIPGSSMRGMVRSMIEMTSYGNFGFINDRVLYFRDFANNPLRKIYSQFNLSAKDGEIVKYNMGCGLLYNVGTKYYIKDYGNPRKIKKENTKLEIEKTNQTIDLDKWSWFISSDEKRIIVISGGIKKKKDWIIDLCEEDENGNRTISKTPPIIPLSKKDIQDYNNDIQRAESELVPNLLNEISKKKTEFPVFFFKGKDSNGDDRISFGHTGMFRLPYKKSIKEHIPIELMDEKKIDLATALFGNNDFFASRLFFEDAACTNKNDEMVFLGVNHPHILSGPKPTTFQHYLVQNSDELENLNHYNSGSNEEPVPIRGNKIYWHKEIDESEWIANYNAVAKSPKQYTRIKPVKTGTTFTGRIRFENLSDVELGALLFALELPEGCCHKIGMGKPLGLGSIHITPSLFLSERNERYTDIKKEWTSPVDETREKDKFKNAFSKYILNNLKSDNKEYVSADLWKEERMNELRIMLDFENIPPNEKTRYMTIQPTNEFKYRPVLPKPSDVK
ncbi:MAG: TIGR03986 family CRISPR-associated RAMP protein [Ignavibacteria bacterium]|nr:TIGR03986 family CRISPR-associated RAMP protein [Ignavibacteria bacterium]